MLQVNTYSSFSAVEDIQKGREGMVLMREEALKGARERRKGNAFLSTLLPRTRSRA